jgi:integrase
MGYVVASQGLLLFC